MSTLSHRLATLRDRVANTPGLKRDTIAVVVAIVIGCTCGGYILKQEHNNWPWEHHFEFAAEFSNAAGVQPSAVQEVRIAGVNVGRITAAQPEADGRAKLTLSIDPEQKIYSNAQLILRTKSPLNIMYVEMNPGGPPGTLLKEGQTIPVSQTERPVQPYEILDKLDDHTRAALTSLFDQAAVALRTAPKDLPASLDATRRTMLTWQPIINQLDQRRSNISSLVSNFAVFAKTTGTDGQRVQVLLSSMRKTLDALGTRDKQLSQTIKALPAFTGHLSTSMTKVTRLARTLNPTLADLDKASGKLPTALDKLGSTVNGIHKTVRAAGPLATDAGPVVHDLSSFSFQADPALRDLRPVAGYLPRAATLVSPWMFDLAAFTYQTSSSFSLYDVNGGLGRADVELDVNNLSGGLQPMDHSVPNTH
ncbi:MlaD family protein [Nocardioides ultimimeridianus]